MVFLYYLIYKSATITGEGRWFGCCKWVTFARNEGENFHRSQFLHAKWRKKACRFFGIYVFQLIPFVLWISTYYSSSLVKPSGFQRGQLTFLKTKFSALTPFLWPAKSLMRWLVFNSPLSLFSYCFPKYKILLLLHIFSIPKSTSRKEPFFVCLNKFKKAYPYHVLMVKYYSLASSVIFCIGRSTI